MLDKAAAEAKKAKVEVVTHPREGDPADAILDVAEENKADLVIVGNKGMTGARRFLLGSVPNKISHHSPCDVLDRQDRPRSRERELTAGRSRGDRRGRRRSGLRRRTRVIGLPELAGAVRGPWP